MRIVGTPSSLIASGVFQLGNGAHASRPAAPACSPPQPAREALRMFLRISRATLVVAVGRGLPDTVLFPHRCANGGGLDMLVLAWAEGKHESRLTTGARQAPHAAGRSNHRPDGSRSAAGTPMGDGTGVRQCAVF